MIFIGYGKQEDTHEDGIPEIQYLLCVSNVNDNDAALLQYLGYEPLDSNNGAIIGEPDSETWVKYELKEMENSTMITASEARQMMHKEVAINECKRRTEEIIRTAINRGQSRVCLSQTSCYLKEDGTVGCSNDRYVDCEYEIKEWLKSLGYRIEPTGYVGGILQKSEDICW